MFETGSAVTYAAILSRATTGMTLEAAAVVQYAWMEEKTISGAASLIAEMTTLNFQCLKMALKKRAVTITRDAT